MKPILVELDDRLARDLERVAPAKRRKRAEFIRLAIRQAIDMAFDRETERVYREQPLPTGLLAEDLEGWDDQNRLALPARRRRRRSRKAA